VNIKITREGATPEQKAALIKGANPGISLGALKGRLAQSADDLGNVGSDPYYGRGFVNAQRACLGR
jgi:hypothetical protein